MQWSDPKKPLVIAHRGFTKDHVENTLEAVEAALQLGVDGVEVDLRLSADGELIVFHDNSLQRLALRDESIEEMTLSGLRDVRLQGSRLPTLEELLDLVRDRALLNLELKTVRWNAQVERKLVATLRSFRLGESILVSSFHPLLLWRMKRIAPGLKRGYLVSDRQRQYRALFSKLVEPYSINPAAEMTDLTLITKAHRTGQRIFTWTVNSVDDMNRFLAIGIDGLFTDRPDDLMRALDRGK